MHSRALLIVIALLGHGCVNRSTLAASLSNSQISIVPDSLAADGTSEAQVRVTLRDGAGNPVAGLGVVLSGSSPALAFVQPTDVTDATGSTTGWVSSTVTGSLSIYATATGAGSDGLLPATGHVTFTAVTPPPPGSPTVAFTASPTSVAADGVSTVALRVTVKDADGNGLSGQAVSFSSTGTTDTFTPTHGPTTASGTFTATLTSTSIQVDTVSATVGSLTKSVTITFVASPVGSIQLTGLLGGPTGTSSTPTVTAYDSGGRVAVNYTGAVSFTSSDPLAALPPAYTFTAADQGVHTFASMVTLITAGMESVTAYASPGPLTSTMSNIPVYAGFHYTLSPNVNTAVNPLQCVELAGGNANVNTPVVIDYCTSSPWQNIWQDNNGTLQISGLCLAPTTYASNANVVAQTCNGSTMQKWTINATTGQYQSAGNSSFCLAASSTTPLTPMVVNTCANVRNQQLLPRSTPPIYAVSNITQQLYLDNSGGNLVPGNAVGQFVGNNSTAQHFFYGHDQTLSVAGTWCVEFPAPQTSGVNAVLNPCTGAATQKFVLSQNRIILAGNANLCVDFAGSTYTIAANTCSGASTQQFAMTSGVGFFNFSALAQPNVCLFSNGENNGLTTGICNDANTFGNLTNGDYTNVRIFLDSLTLWNTGGGITLQQPSNFANDFWQIYTADLRGFYSLHNVDCLGVTATDPVLMTCSTSDANQVFSALNAAPSFALASNPTLCLSYTSYLSGTPLQLSPCTATKSSTQTFAFLSDSTVQYADLCMAAPTGIQAGANVVQAPCTYDGNQTWTVAAYNSITSTTDTSLCWTPSSATAGALVQLQACTQSALQLFNLF